MYASGGHQRGKSWCKQIRKRRCKINQGKRAKHAAIKEAAPGTPGWFKKVLKRGVPKVFQELSCRRPSCLIPDSSAYMSLIVFCFLLTLALRLFQLFSSFVKGCKGYKDGLQPETLADGNWLMKQNQPVSKIETRSDTNLRSLYES
jgi:hypothetical protein